MTTVQDELPGLPPAQTAANKAQEYLGDGYTVDLATMLPNPLQGLWVVSYTDDQGHPLDGAVLAVTEDTVYPLSSDPGADEYQGVLWPEDDEEYIDDAEPDTDSDDAELAALLAQFGVSQFGSPTQSFDDTVCIMAVPAEDWEGHGIGPEEKHATVLYFGDKADHEDPARMGSAKGLLLEALTVAASEQAPFTAAVTGVQPLGDEGAQVWMLDSPELQRLFEEIPGVDSEVGSLYDGASGTKYPEYLPHVTIGYTGDDSAGSGTGETVSDEDMARARAVQEVPFDRLSLWWGTDHHDVPLGAGEFEALLEHFEFDPTQPRATGGPGGGQWIEPGQGEGAAPKDEKPKPKDEKPKDDEPPMTKQERVKALVEGVLKALDDVMDQLTGPQAQALIKRIKANAEAFISGQQNAPHHGGGGGSKPGGGGGKAKPSGSTPTKSGGKTGGKSGPNLNPGGDGSNKGGLAGIIEGVQSLIKSFGNQMKPEDRARLDKAVKALDAAK